MSKTKTPYRFLFPSLLTVGLLFFVLPDWNLYDFLPDFIGFLILYFSLERIAELDYRTEAARRYMLGYALLSFSKFIASFLSGGFSASSDQLLATSVFNISAAILFFLVVKNLFDGLNYTLIRNNAESSLKALNEAKALTFSFGFTKIALNFLPQSFALIELGDGSIQSSAFYTTLKQIQSLTLLFCMTATLFFGIYWFVGMRKLLTVIKKDESFINTAFNRYDTEVGQDIRYLARKKWLAAKYAAGVGFVLLLTVQFDGKQYMPWFISGFVFALATFILAVAYKSYTKENIGIGKGYYLLCAAFCISEGVSFVYRNTENIEFYLKYSDTKMMILALLAALSGILLTLVTTKLLHLFRTAEETLFDVHLENRYKFQYLFLFILIVLRTAQTAAQPLREYLGALEIIIFIVFITIYSWYLRKEE